MSQPSAYFQRTQKQNVLYMTRSQWNYVISCDVRSVGLYISFKCYYFTKFQIKINIREPRGFEHNSQKTASILHTFTVLHTHILCVHTYIYIHTYTYVDPTYCCCFSRVYYYCYLLQLRFHSVAVVLTLVQTKKIIYINETIQKHSTNNTKHSKYKYTY